MADKVILVDTSILIDYYRKTNKASSVWIGFIDREYEFVISAITKYMSISVIFFSPYLVLFV